jgi:oligoribonuclease NrnB/cAMP/cGMP phosphodiesterase (DHH superfamily)
MSKVWKPTPKTALVTHKGCLDGTGSALMFIWAGGKRENIFFRNPSMCYLTPQEAATFDEVWFADVCPSSMEDPSGGLPFHVFDHHISNQRKFGDDPRCTFDMKKSGTSLMAEVLDLVKYEDGTGYIASLIEALEDYDLGRFEKPMGVRLADAASSYTQDEMLDQLIMHGADTMYEDHIVARADALSSIRNMYAEQAARYAYSFQFPGTGDEIIECGMASSPVYWKNEVALRILKDHDLALVVDPTTQMVSLRSKEGGPDCSIIAARYGGGGHARAAGFKANGLQMLNALTEAVIG